MGRIHQRVIRTVEKPEADKDYSSFDRLDGSHDWQTSVDQSYVLYPVRKLNQGRVVYFNFNLAREMGLISKNHPQVMNKKLEKKLLETFSIRIINEYDQNKNIIYHPATLKPKPYMATRYLQMQHSNKAGKTSGDGRSIWNGRYEHNGKVWDVSSRGTGVTKLSPGAVEAQKPLKSGGTQFGYGCGMADLDELVGAAILAEIFHNNHVNTERVLTVIDLGDGNGIGVRAGQNLFRPAHLFVHLKQNNLHSLKQAVDYTIDRQYKNKSWSFNSLHKNKYDLMLQEISESFAQFTAQLDREYIFAWLDWDGDNVLINAGIIDYGSIRQFGLRHDQYRYDDVDRFSTNLSEQKAKARMIVQVFAQMVDYLKTGSKKSFHQFKTHWSVKSFDSHFRYYLLDQFLLQVGFSKNKRELLLTEHRSAVEKLFQNYSQLETIKTRKNTQKVSDGINRPAIFNMRSILYELPHYILEDGKIDLKNIVPPQIFFEMILAESARGKDRKLTKSISNKIVQFQNSYFEILKLSLGADPARTAIMKIYELALQSNRPHRVTGDGLLYIVDEILRYHKKSKDTKSIQEAIDRFILDQSPLPSLHADTSSRLHHARRAKTLFQTMLSLVDGFRESI